MLITQWHLTVLHLVPHTTCRWLSHWEAKTLLSRPRENSLSLRMPGSLPAAKPRRLRWNRNSCCCWGLNSRPRRAHTTECRLHHHCWAWRDEQETRFRLFGDWHQPSWKKGKAISDQIISDQIINCQLVTVTYLAKRRIFFKEFWLNCIIYTL